MTRYQMTTKRIFDAFVSFLGLVILSPIILISWFLASYDTKSNGFFLQERVGRHGLLFKIVKIKTMTKIKGVSTTVTSSNDPRITKLGGFFRRTKIDELPQLWNVLIGDMSFVGPRPDVPGYADKLVGDDRRILQIRPGITGPAQIYFSNEEVVLSAQKDPSSYNDQVIWPKKVEINKRYLDEYSLMRDIGFILQTIRGRS